MQRGSELSEVHEQPRGCPPAVAAVAAVVLTILGAALGCEPDHVEPDAFARPSVPGTAGADAGSGASDGASPAADGSPDLGADPPGRSDAAAALDGSPAAASCDLAGRWLLAERVLVTSTGQEQSARTWYYYEVKQQGADLTVTRGLHCGYEVVKKTALGASVDSSGSWAAFLVHNSSAGRRGTLTEQSGGCRLTLAREYVVRGATLPHYADPAHKLPDRTQPATASTPGWEDWDGDGNPGISIRVSSTLASGTLYDCQREWTQFDAVIPRGATKFKIPMTADNEHVVLGRSAGSPQTLESSSSLASDPSQHFAWLHRLQPEQATGTDAEVCAAVRTLKDQLVPEAAQ